MVDRPGADPAPPGAVMPPASSITETRATVVAAKPMRRWQTEDRPLAEQYPYWREVVCAAFTTLNPATRGSERDRWDRPGLPGWVNSLPIGSINAAEVESCDQLIRHGQAQVRAMEGPVVFVNLQLRGRSVVAQDGRTCLSGPGTFSLVDATRPFTLDYLDTWRAISFRMPVDSLGDLTAPDRSITARTFDASYGIGRVLAHTMRSLWTEGMHLDEAAADAGAAAVGLLALALNGSTADRGVDDAGSASSLRRAIDDYVENNVEYADLRPEPVARIFGISLRKLHQLYEGQPRTFAQMVMLARARACAGTLIDEPATTLTEVAAKWGFSDLSHMNRVFRKLFNHSPAEFRDGGNGPRDLLLDLGAPSTIQRR